MFVKLMFYFLIESDNISLASSTSGQYYNHSKESRPSNASSSYAGQMSATESSRGDDPHDSSDNESMRGNGPTFSFICTYNNYRLYLIQHFIPILIKYLFFYIEETRIAFYSIFCKTNSVYFYNII